MDLNLLKTILLSRLAQIAVKLCSIVAAYCAAKWGFELTSLTDSVAVAAAATSALSFIWDLVLYRIQNGTWFVHPSDADRLKQIAVRDLTGTRRM